MFWSGFVALCVFLFGVGFCVGDLDIAVVSLVLYLLFGYFFAFMLAVFTLCDFTCLVILVMLV